MSIRTVADPLQTPPQDSITLGVARHLTSAYLTPEMLQFHRDRSALIHALVEEESLDVLSWGTTDREDPPNEVVEVLIAIGSALTTGAATVIASWIGRPKRANVASSGSEPNVLGIAVRRSDGKQIWFDYRGGKPQEVIADSIRAFLQEPGPVPAPINTGPVG